jgi:AraC-like DNA-binding protein
MRCSSFAIEAVISLLRQATSKKQVAADAFAFFDLASEVEIEAPAVDNISLALSRRRLEALFPVLDHGHGTVITPCPLSRILLGMMENIIAIGPAMTVAEARPIADAIIQLVAAALDAPLRQQVRMAGGNGAVSQIAIKAEIERRLTDPALGPQALLDTFGITRSTLYRLFEPSGGVAVYIAKQRLRLAFRRITDPTEPALRFSQLAFDLGFSHASAFTRAFGEFFGMSPKDAKALAVQAEEHELEFLLSPEGRPYIHPLRGTPATAVAR